MHVSRELHCARTLIVRLGLLLPLSSFFAEQAISEQKMALKILRLIGVLDCVGVKKTTLYRWIREGKFPAPVQLGARSVGWRATDVQQWVESRQSTRGQA
ncbi:helix-turn-helix transcriptional regulator [Burkholderia gladioli]|uniref:helix-turn-helix transcriptional regulator n=1 Tax=Burkholderia gladioli TaxID=28095 RepID=UPI001FC8141C|nr:AlpA family phage regulatory protein [Burkholderia gladioli]